MSGGRSPKRVGYYHEKRMEERFQPFGFKRMVMSGALGGDYGGDLRRTPDDLRRLSVLEVKRRAGGQRLLRKWLKQGHAQGLVLPGDRGDDALVVVELHRFLILLAEAHYGREWAESQMAMPQNAPGSPAEPRSNDGTT
jgi:hypothetical protein